ncbi:hypothetical protein ACJIZ3_011667 [Penstemon smallii]|uniref:Uncharacterized protein n=1 Tax=Penstemon smallii TaxID=265156 RepID=A0ABD3UK67_9LAMI
MYNKLFPFIADSTASRVFLHQNQLIHGTNLLGSNKNQIFVSFCSLVNVNLSGVSSKISKKKTKNLDKEKAYTVSYLIDSCGLSPETAISASEKVRLKNSEKPNSVLAILSNNGFTKAQIACVVRKRPGILVSKEKTILPKLEFFHSIGLSKSVLAATISRDPTLLTRSLENQILPSYNFLKSVLLTDEMVASSMKRTSWSFLDSPEKSLAPNIKVLRELNVPESCIRLLLAHYPEAILIKPDEFNVSVSKVLEMGFNPLKSTFVLALHAISGYTNKVTWAQCYETYSKWGWSKDDIYMAFRKHPNCMIMSEKKISKTMDFLVNKIGWDSRMIAERPVVLFFNLENRIIPRCSVIQVLESKGLIRKHLKLSSFLPHVEKEFLRKFVVPYEKEVPKLHDLYKGKISVEEL